MNYTESKQKIDAIRDKYGCKGEVIFRTAIQYVIEYGQHNFLDEIWYRDLINDIDDRHDIAEEHGKILFMTRDFEKAILECAKDLAQIKAYDFLRYIQKEVWLGGGKVGEPDYQKAMQIIRNCLCYTADRYGAYRLDEEETLEAFRCFMDDEEIEHFGWGELLNAEEEYEDDY